MGMAVDYLDPKTGTPPIGKYTGKPDIEFPIAIEELKIQKGKIDRVLVYDNAIWLVEIKSVGDDKFQNQIHKPQEDHIVQGTIYVFGFELCLQRGDYDHIPRIKKDMEVKGIIYLYVSRDSGKMKEYFIPRDEKKFLKICKDVEDLSYYIDRKELPPPPPPGVCKFCPYPDYCKNNKNVK
jgi:CRISPR/Cas system-associated exonuclease Cas4 (RecB family)